MLHKRKQGSYQFRLTPNLSGDQRDVRRVENLRPVRQALGPQLRRRMEGVRVAAAEPHLGAEPLSDEVLDLERPARPALIVSRSYITKGFMAQ